MYQIPGNRPVAFPVPCCDSLNTPSPRFFAEIFNKTNPKGQFLTIDTSVFNLLTADDPDLPRSLVLDEDGREKFRKYIPFPSFVNTIENYQLSCLHDNGTFYGWELGNLELTQ